ncbi:hypothetical protein M441DRAFT_42972 [Trichoderma asperellum CBS 433.97]|uniref:Uncharacterized protein n=1 Tax=Trichoderma asperellum (strain ATCC 204424 / CBS 433.97 / NBRC 101777) TaxID=1042311 RepID=A0A2T3ZJ81_TRIA4|nr:hypothetical protein M441DRAFT_42972 [Trichoderma asperellum CBS 433.97]PTB44823.1 hypothetical protein M441DRAFT_42972 [Trichoderma asperellum CBS 433.97]
MHPSSPSNGDDLSYRGVEPMMSEKQSNNAKMDRILYLLRAELLTAESQKSRGNFLHSSHFACQRLLLPPILDILLSCSTLPKMLILSPLHYDLRHSMPSISASLCYAFTISLDTSASRYFSVVDSIFHDILVDCLSSLHQHSPENTANLAWNALEDVHKESRLSGLIKIIWLNTQALDGRDYTYKEEIQAETMKRRDRTLRPNGLLWPDTSSRPDRILRPSSPLWPAYLYHDKARFRLLMRHITGIGSSQSHQRTDLAEEYINDGLGGVELYDPVAYEAKQVGLPLQEGFCGSLLIMPQACSKSSGLLRPQRFDGPAR